jgi:predicted HAD superfamily Cof-like phosphohydrolase
MNSDTIRTTLGWFEKAKPEPTRQDLNTQLGVHCEEVVEMLEELTPQVKAMQIAIENARSAMHILADLLKATPNGVVIKEENRKDYLDALCDQVVTAVGCGYMSGMDLSEAMVEVNRGNWSKFDDDGNPIFDANRKIMKGPNYVKPDLSTYV